MWSIAKQKFTNVDMEMIGRIIDKLNAIFDPFDYYHHSSCSGELFEFILSTDRSRHEAWEITFKGLCVASGGGKCWGRDYDDFYEDDYIELTSENEEKIIEMAKTNTIGIIESFIKLGTMADLPKPIKESWKDLIDEDIEKFNKHKVGWKNVEN